MCSSAWLVSAGGWAGRCLTDKSPDGRGERRVWWDHGPRSRRAWYPHPGRLDGGHDACRHSLTDRNDSPLLQDAASQLALSCVSAWPWTAWPWTTDGEQGCSAASEAQGGGPKESVTALRCRRAGVRKEANLGGPEITRSVELCRMLHGRSRGGATEVELPAAGRQGLPGPARVALAAVQVQDAAPEAFGAQWGDADCNWTTGDWRAPPSVSLFLCNIARRLD